MERLKTEPPVQGKGQCNCFTFSWSKPFCLIIRNKLLIFYQNIFLFFMNAVPSAVEILPGHSQPMSQGHQQDLPAHS